MSETESIETFADKKQSDTEGLRAKLYRVALGAFVHGRSAVYQTESLLGPALELLMNRRRPHLPTDNPELFKEARLRLQELLNRDVDNVVQGIYPPEVLFNDDPVSHLRRMPEMLLEGMRIVRRRREHSAHEFSNEAKEHLEQVPDYYQRNFHFQGDGYLSDRSARLYDHQVDILFGGAADAMRRLILPPLKKHLTAQAGLVPRFQGEGMKILELGSGTGRATRFIRLMLPKAKIVCVDLSAPYLKKARTDLNSFSRIDFIEGDAAQLPFLNDTFDAVVSVFLFHEVPGTVRKEILSQTNRVLKPGGFFAYVDSLQTGDAPLFDSALERFPVEFHEPFYRGYVQTPMEVLIKDAGFTQIETKLGFFAKCVTATAANHPSY